MREDSFFRLVQRLRKAYCGRSSGSSLLWAIGSLVVIGILGAAMALMTPSTMQSKLEQEAGMRAYYNANAGLNFILTMHNVANRKHIAFSNYMIAMGSSSESSYNLGGNSFFVYTLGNIKTNDPSGSYQITNLVGMVANSLGGAAYQYAIYGGGKGNSSVLQYDVSLGDNRQAANNLMVASAINLAGNTQGDILAKGLAIADGVTVGGSITTTDSNSLLTIQGGANITGNLCSANNINILGGSVVTGTVRSQGDVQITSSTITGDVYAQGNVTIDGGGTQNGNVYSQKNISVAYVTMGSKKKKYLLSGLSSVNINAWETLYSDLNSPGSVYLYNATLWGDVSYGVTFVNSGTLKGSSGNDFSNPPPASGCGSFLNMSLPTFTASTPWTILSDNVMHTLTSGTYYFTDLTANGGSELCLDVSHGDIVILTTGDVKLNGHLYIKTSSIDNCATMTEFSSINVSYYADAAKVFLGTKKTFTLNGGSHWFGAVLANGDVQPGGGSAVVGSLYSINGTINPAKSWYNIRYVKSNYLSQ